MGVFGNLFILLILYALMSQIFLDFIIGNISNQIILGLIIFSLMFISIVLSLLISLWITNDVKLRAIYKAMVLSFFGTLIVLTFLSYFSLYALYPDVFNEISGIEVLWVFPQVIMTFSIYVLSHPFYIVIIVSIIYFAFYIFLLEYFYEPKIINLQYDKTNNPRYR